MLLTELPVYLVSIQPLFRRSQIDSVPFLRPSEQATKSSGAEFLTLGVMVVSSKDIDTLQLRCFDGGVITYSSSKRC